MRKKQYRNMRAFLREERNRHKQCVINESDYSLNNFSMEIGSLITKRFRIKI